MSAYATYCPSPKETEPAKSNNSDLAFWILFLCYLALLLMLSFKSHQTLKTIDSHKQEKQEIVRQHEEIVQQYEEHINWLKNQLAESQKVSQLYQRNNWNQIKQTHAINEKLRQTEQICEELERENQYLKRTHLMQSSEMDAFTTRLLLYMCNALYESRRVRMLHNDIHKCCDALKKFARAFK